MKVISKGRKIHGLQFVGRQKLHKKTHHPAFFQDLMELFIKYQVPSDLLTACSEGEATPEPATAMPKR